MVELTSEANWSWTFFVWMFLVSDSILLVICLLWFSVSLWFSLSRLYVSRNLNISRSSTLGNFTIEEPLFRDSLKHFRSLCASTHTHRASLNFISTNILHSSPKPHLITYIAFHPSMHSFFDSIITNFRYCVIPSLTDLIFLCGREIIVL